MGNEEFDVNNTSVQMLLVLKLQQLKRESMPSLTYKNLEDYLSKMRWKRKRPTSLHQAADEVMSIRAEHIVRYLTHQAIVEGSQESLADFQDLIGGKF